MAHLHPLYDTDPHFSIDKDSRIISYESNDKLVIVQGDHNSERYTFELPRYVEGHDMLLCNLAQVHFINIDGKDSSIFNSDVYEIKDVQVHPDDESILVFSWLVSQKATKLVGSLSFVIRFACTSGYRIDYSWGTCVYSAITIAKSIDNAGLVVEQYSDTLQNWYFELLSAGTMGVNLVADARDKALTDITNEVAAYKEEIEKLGEETKASIPADYASVLDDIDKYGTNTGHIFKPGYVSAIGKFITDNTSTRIVSDFICCPENIEVTFSGENNHSNICAVSFYDEGRNFISGVCNVGDLNEVYSTVSPAGTYYIRLSTKVGLPKVLVFGEGAIPKVVAQCNDKVDTIKTQIIDSLLSLVEGSSSVYSEKVLFRKGSMHTGGYKSDKDTCYSNLFSTRVSSLIEFDDSLYKVLYVYYDENKGFVKHNEWIEKSPAGGISTDYPYVAFELRTRNGSAVDVEVIDATVHTYLDNIASATKEVYVAPDGSDDNDGSINSPFATLSAAIKSGRKNICVKAGEYVDSVSVSNIDGLNIYAYNGDTYNEAKPETRRRPTFTNGAFVDISLASAGVYGTYSFTLKSAPKSYMDVFIHKTVAPETGASRPSFAAGLWLNHKNKYKDVKLKPVLSITELPLESNTFFFDGTKVYANVSSRDVIGFTVVRDEEVMLDFYNCNNLSINGLVVKYGSRRNLRVVKSNNVHIANCEFGYTMRSDNVTGDYSNIIFDNCLSYKARNDGFNTHYYGVTILNNCRGVYNYDDGESSHEYCEIVVNGGEYAHNGKSGHAPVNGCKFNCNNSYVHNNSVGLYMIADEGFDLSDSAIQINGCTVLNNSDEDIRVKLYDVIAMNTKYRTTDIISGTFSDVTL